MTATFDPTLENPSPQQAIMIKAGFGTPISGENLAGIELRQVPLAGAIFVQVDLSNADLGGCVDHPAQPVCRLEQVENRLDRIALCSYHTR
mgnify:CR=1 FL=1